MPQSRPSVSAGDRLKATQALGDVIVAAMRHACESGILNGGEVASLARGFSTPTMSSIIPNQFLVEPESGK